ncbi:MAG TPA: GNAT family N-acetyltransferase [Actinomycetota bacterium]|nr:GNAT family N-acetyltransferase [Actinomycetota bacterium]
MGVLETDRLLLEPWADKHKNDFATLATDPDVVRYVGRGKPWSRDRVEEVFVWQSAHWREHGFGWRAAIQTESGLFIGFVGLNFLRPEATETDDHNQVEIGWWIRPQFWNQGFATEGAIALRDEAFERVGLDRIIGRYQSKNVASGRIMEKLGMRFERDAVSYGRQVRIYTLSREEWRARRSASRT